MPDIKLNTIFGNPALPVKQYPGFHDDFNAADGDLDFTGDGKTWLRYESAAFPSLWVRTGGKAKCNTGSGTNICVVDALTPNGKIIQVVGSTGTAHLGGVVFRAVDINNYWNLRWRVGGADFRYILQKVIGGEVTTAASAASVQSANGDVITVDLSGSSIVVKVNGTTIMSPTSADLQTATKHGLYCTSSDYTPTYESMEFVPVGGTPQL